MPRKASLKPCRAAWNPASLVDSTIVCSFRLHIAATGGGRADHDSAGPRGGYLRWRILARIRRFLRPTLRRPLCFFMSSIDLSGAAEAEGRRSPVRWTVPGGRDQLRG